MLLRVPPCDDNLKVVPTPTTYTGSNGAGWYDFGTNSQVAQGERVTGVIDISAINMVTGDEIYSFVLQESADNVTYTNIGAIGKSPTAVGIMLIDGVRHQEFVRILLTVAGTNPSVTYQAWITIGLPV